MAVGKNVSKIVIHCMMRKCARFSELFKKKQVDAYWVEQLFINVMSLSWSKEKGFTQYRHRGQRLNRLI